MKHLGDITKLDGHNVPLVDIVCGGSPCQDLSVAGHRKGLAGERSGLFMEQIRVIKEMRDESAKRLCVRGSDEHIRPRYMVWENVPGAFSSNKGEDFRAVLEETAKIVCENAVIPRPKDGKWSSSGCIMGDGWSIAWRVHDAQFWGVPQRRKRIALVADFGGDTAPEILFERQGLSGNTEESREKRENTSQDAQRGIGEAISFQERAGKAGGVKESSFSMSEQEPCQHSTTKAYCLQENGIDRADTAGCNGKGWRENQSYTLNTIDRPAVYSIGHDIRSAKITDDEITDPLTATDYKDPTKVYQQNVGALCARDFKGVGNEYAEQDKVICESTVRRLTPMECERLQGYPDHWTDIGEWVDSKGKLHKDADSPRYKALGNSIALPFWEWMAKRMVSYLDTDKPTMASLFDGIGGFPLVYSRSGAEPIWASEIEEFPIAVTKIRFPDKEEG